MRRITLAVLAGGIVGACGGGGDDPPGPSGSLNVSGSWFWQANGANQEMGVSCISSGQLTLAQSGAEVSGVLANAAASCVTQDGTNVEFDPGGDFTGGTVSGNTFSYSDDACTFTGTGSGGTPTTRVSGPASCNLEYRVQGFLAATVPVSGTWEMHK